MRWYVLLAHPNPNSFNHAVCDAFAEGLKQAGAVFDINDLCATGFNPVFGGNDFNQFSGEGELPADVLAEQEKVGKCDCLALIYPVWWNDAPAILKGWIDRVLSKGWAYDITPDGKVVAMLKLKKVVILNTGDNPDELNEDGGLNRAARLTKAAATFQFCGVPEIQHNILNSVSSDEEGRKRFLQEARRIGQSG